MSQWKPTRIRHEFTSLKGVPKQIFACGHIYTHAKFHYASEAEYMEKHRASPEEAICFPCNLRGLPLALTKVKFEGQSPISVSKAQWDRLVRTKQVDAGLEIEPY